MILFTIYEFIMNVLLLNIMIASMTSSFGKVTQVGGGMGCSNLLHDYWSTLFGRG